MPKLSDMRILECYDLQAFQWFSSNWNNSNCDFMITYLSQHIPFNETVSFLCFPWYKYPWNMLKITWTNIFIMQWINTSIVVDLDVATFLHMAVKRGSMIVSTSFVILQFSNNQDWLSSILTTILFFYLFFWKM